VDRRGVVPWRGVVGQLGGRVSAAKAWLGASTCATLSANIGVNPSLTITAQAERATVFWPIKGEADTRAALGAKYQRVDPVQPKSPVAPATAPAALRLHQALMAVRQLQHATALDRRTSAV
jgi:hypothetical protein